MNGMKRIFVYGSLRSGMYNNPRLANSKKVADAELAGDFAMVDLGAYPALVHERGGSSSIVGEIWDVDPDTFESIDRMERGAGYAGELVTVRASGRGESALVYVMGGAATGRFRGCPRVAGGCWVTHVRERELAHAR